MKTSRYKIFLACLAASCFSFYNLMVFALMNVLGVYLAAELKLTSTEIATLASWDLWGNVLGFIPVGLLLDRYPVRRVGMVLLLIAIGATAMMAFATEIWLFSLLRFLQGIASAGSLLILMRLGTSFTNQYTNQIIGLMIVVALAGGMAGNTLFAYFAQQLGWRNGLYCLAGIGCFCLLVMSVGLAEWKPVIRQQRFHLILSKTIVFSGLQIGLLNAPIIVLGSLFGNHYLIEQQHLTLQQAANISSVMFAGIMFGSPLIGILADRLGSARLLVAGYITLGATLLCLVFGVPNSYHAIVALFFILGLASCTQNLIYPFIATSHPHERSASMGAASVISNSLSAIFQVLSGRLF